MYNDSSSSTIASCGPAQIFDIIQPGPTGVKFNASAMNLNVNLSFVDTYTYNDWVNIFTHELGHALGIGTLWSDSLKPYGAKPPFGNFLDGTAYVNSKNAYNTLTGVTRTKIPTESSGGPGTADGHWENNFRSSSGLSYPAITNELMVGFVGPNMKITKLTIGALVDFGYEEVLPGASEGSPVIATSITAPSLGSDENSVSTEQLIPCSSNHCEHVIEKSGEVVVDDSGVVTDVNIFEDNVLRF
jgi:hypothetical protein